MAVNMALMSLNKLGVFCTEPFRVPSAGKITHCFFDKTGTLTTDQLVPAGVINSNSRTQDLDPVPQANAEASLVLAACHSLVEVENEAAPASAPTAAAPVGTASTSATAAAKTNTKTVAGDPIELTALNSIAWTWHGASATAKPGAWAALEQSLVALSAKSLEWDNMPVAQRPADYATTVESLKARVAALSTDIAAAKQRACAAPFRSARVVSRHHFASALQRMSVVACVDETDWYCLVKGAPEALRPLYLPSAIPSWYDECYEKLARQGLRVLALAYRKLDCAAVRAARESSSTDASPLLQRGAIESDLNFCGFIAFECKVRADSPVVVQALRDSGHGVTMLTGDGLLTSLHVAKTVGICATAATAPSATLTPATGGSFEWVTHAHGQAGSRLPVDSKATDLGVAKLAATYDLITTEAAFVALAECTGGASSPLWQTAAQFRVFARCSPKGKAQIIKAVQAQTAAAGLGGAILMCGDGGNDVGALKQADVGLALLAGHSNANTTEELGAVPSSSSSSDAPATSAEDLLNAHDKVVQTRNAAFAVKHTAHMKTFQEKLKVQLAEETRVKIAELSQRGEFRAMVCLTIAFLECFGLDIVRDLYVWVCGLLRISVDGHEGHGVQNADHGGRREPALCGPARSNLGSQKRRRCRCQWFVGLVDGRTRRREQPFRRANCPTGRRVGGSAVYLTGAVSARRRRFDPARPLHLVVRVDATANHDVGKHHCGLHAQRLVVAQCAQLGTTNDGVELVDHDGRHLV